VRPGPAFSVADVHDGWVQGLRAVVGDGVVDYNHDARIEFYARAAIEHDPGEFKLALDPKEALRLALNSLHAVCYQFRPDVLFVTSGFYLTAEHLDVIRSRGTRVCLLHTESPYEDDVQLRRAAHADINLINDPTNLDDFRRVAPTYYMPHAWRPDRHRPRVGLPEHKSDFAFVGTGFPSRISFFEQVDFDGIDVALAGQWQTLPEGSPLRRYVAHPLDRCCDNAETADLYAATRASANLYRTESNRPDLATGWSMSPREVELAATGTFFLRAPRGEGDRVLSMLPRFVGPDDFGEQLRWWLARDGLRQRTADAARHAVAERTFERHARELMRLLDKLTA
jgi:spore maturation protein CgeB